MAAAHGSAFDVAIDFGRKSREDADPDFFVRVAMSWEHAVSMRALLDRLIANYEGKVGQIPDVEKAGFSAVEEAQ